MRAYYNENDPMAARWLDNLIAAGEIAAGVVDDRSIANVQAEEIGQVDQVHLFAGVGGWPLALRLAGWPDEIGVWTCSCPCQPFSSAGRRRGTDDARHLWPQAFRLIRLCRPGVVLGEQVASADGLQWFDGVSADLESEGYAVGAVDLCAAGLAAPHIRQRLYWVAVSAEREKRIRGRGTVGKRIVHGLLERGGEVKASVVPSTEAAELQPIIRKNVAAGSNVMTDEALAYNGLDRDFIHAVVNHAQEYVRGQVHTNGIENFWSLFKRALKGTYVHVAPFHLQRYVDEEVFRFNARKTDDAGRFDTVMGTTVGRRLTHRRLCGTDGAGFMGIQ